MCFSKIAQSSESLLICFSVASSYHIIMSIRFGLIEFCTISFCTCVIIIRLVNNLFVCSNVRIFLIATIIFTFIYFYFLIYNDSKQFTLSLIYMHLKNCNLLTIAKNRFISANLLSGMILNKGNKAQKKGY